MVDEPIHHEVWSSGLGCGTRCGKEVPYDFATGGWVKVTCPTCLEHRPGPPLDPGEAVGFLHSIASGEITLTPVDRTWQETHAGDVEYLASNGWRITVFNDCDSWDYIDRIVSADGRVLEFDDFDEEIGHWYPSKKVARKQFGIKTGIFW